ncbi:MAG TPA: ABC transporter permease [Nitrospirae bacterium]|nr:ABC transporter permease [Nitrospirota bacterium]HDO66819.1 ABC transporter permease [Nitrospirota bacterium]HDZ83740.1 ABC transporter permease [Nitrospirota bacterium]HEW80993.1 ABC transporter permease [Nitrospirota bacterium]
MAEEVSRFTEAWRIFNKNRLALWGLVIFTVFFLVAVSGLVLTVGDNPVLDPAKVRLSEKLLPPVSPVDTEMVKPEDRPFAGIYLLGTDDLGRDVLARMMQGAWVSLTVGFVAVGIAVLIGIIMGGLAGYYGNVRINFMQLLAMAAFFTSMVFLISGQKEMAINFMTASALFVSFSIVYYFVSVKGSGDPGAMRFFFFDTVSVDSLIMRFVDIMLCFPSFFLILTVVAILPASIYNIMIVIGLTGWMGTTRFVRAEFLSLREQDFVSAARAMGIRDMSIIFRHMIPNAIAPVLVSATIGIAGAILTEAGLSFLGFGVPPPHATWGNILSDGKRFLFDAPWLTYIPGLSILVVVLAFNLFGEGLRDALNPRLRKR